MECPNSKVSEVSKNKTLRICTILLFKMSSYELLYKKKIIVITILAQFPEKSILTLTEK